MICAKCQSYVKTKDSLCPKCGATFLPEPPMKPLGESRGLLTRILGSESDLSLMIRSIPFLYLVCLAMLVVSGIAIWVGVIIFVIFSIIFSILSDVLHMIANIRKENREIKKMVKSLEDRFGKTDNK